MQKRTRKIAFITIIAMVSILASPLASFAANQKTYVLKFAWNDMWGPKFRASQVYRPLGEMQRMLYKRSNGRLQLKIVSRMFPGKDILKSVAMGKADAGDVPMPYHSGTYPLWNWGEIPGIVDSNPLIGFNEELAVYQDKEIMDVYEKTMGKIGVKYWFATQWDPGNGIWSKKKIETLDDLKGMKVWTHGYLPTIGLKALGASTVSIPGSEVVPAMITGTIDAALVPLAYGYSIGLAKVSKHFTLTPLSPTWSAITVVNKRKFQSLPPDLQKIFLDVGREIEQMVNLSTQAEYVMSMDAVDLSGVKRGRLTPESHAEAVRRMKIVEQEWLKLTKDQGKKFLPLVKKAVNNYRSFNGK